MKKKYIAMFMVFIMLFSNTAFAATNDKSDKQGSEALKQKIESIHDEQNKLLNSVESVQNQVAKETYQTLVANIRSEDIYSSCYGGAYINDDNKLVVRLTNISEENVQKIRAAAEDNNVVIEYSTVTLEYLKELKGKYSAKIEQLLKSSNPTDCEKLIIENLVGISVVQTTSEIVIEMFELNDEKIEAFRTVFGNDENIRFKNSERISLTSSWYTGSEIYVANKGSMSAGYRAYYINSAGVRINGFITAGHGCNVGNTVYGVTSSGQIVLGTCMMSMFTGGTDAAFVKITNSNYTMTNTINSAIASGSVLATTVATGSDLAEGTRVYSFGMKTNMQSGTIVCNDYDFVFEDEDVQR